jgi:peptide/nickel transport system substrate-binding protein/oligopeptide transport system substrate-binding protein
MLRRLAWESTCQSEGRPQMPRPAQVRDLTFVALLLMVLLVGCSAPWPFPQPTPDLKLPDSQQIFRPQETGPANGDLETLDPALIEFPTDYDNAQLIFPGLLTLDEHSQPVDWAAQSHEVSPDGLTYTFHLRAGMTWSDGTPIDANTFAYSFTRALDPCTASPVSYYLYPIKGAKEFNTSRCPVGALHSSTMLIRSSLLIPDPMTLRIRLQQPAGYFLSALTYSLSWAVPQKLIEKYPSRNPPDSWTEHLADNGGFGGNLYRLTKWDHAGHMAFERNEGFWGHKPVIRRIEYTLYRMVDAAWTDFTAGNGDLSQPPVTQLEAAKSTKATVFQQAQLLSISWLQPNWHIAPFDDVRVRQAFSLAINRQTIAHEVYHDTVIPSIHLVPEGMPSYNPALADSAGRTGSDALTPDLATARALISSYATEKCGGQVVQCPSIALEYVSQNQGLISSAIVQQWQAAFPQWRISSSGCGRGRQVITSNPQSVQLLSEGWLADYPDPQDFLSLLWSTHGAYNRSFVSIPAVDALCAQADAINDQAGRIQLYQQAEQVLVNQGAAIPFRQNMATYVVRSRVVGWRMAPAGQTPLAVWQQVYIRR